MTNDYEKLVKAFEKYKNLFECYTVKLKEDNKEALAKGLYGMLDMKLTMNLVSSLYKTIKNEPLLHVNYWTMVQNESEALLNKIHTSEELHEMPYVIEKQMLELNVTNLIKESKPHKKCKI